MKHKYFSQFPTYKVEDDRVFIYPKYLPFYNPTIYINNKHIFKKDIEITQDTIIVNFNQEIKTIKLYYYVDDRDFIYTNIVCI